MTGNHGSWVSIFTLIYISYTIQKSNNNIFLCSKNTLVTPFSTLIFFLTFYFNFLRVNVRSFLSIHRIIDVYFAKLINTLIYTQFQPQAHGLVK
jgi:small basic protein